jgi:hypothetical protein
MKRRAAVAIVCAAALLVMGGIRFEVIGPSSTGDARTYGGRMTWAEVEWPFPRDPWGRGKAFACGAAECGAEVALYVRAKLGLCDCSRGVEDDAELERISDIDLIGDRYQPFGSGQPMAVGAMRGRSRAYITGSRGSAGTALLMAFHDRCDLVVATAVMKDRAPDAERAVVAFLNSDVVRAWLERTLGL